jgi:hypothetical protein
MIGRTVSVVVTCGEDCLGSAGPWAIAGPWWADVAPVNARMRAELGVPAMVLRLLDVVGGEGGRDGHVRYHAEALRRPAHVRLDPAPHGWSPDPPDPLRAAWATRDGLAAALGWAEDALRAAGRPATGTADQVRTWNLSGLFRIPTASGPVWLKTLAAFAADEAAVIGTYGRVAPSLVPKIVDADPVGRRLLLEHVPGVDCSGGPPEAIRAAASGLAAAQAALADSPDLIPVHVADRCLPVLAHQVAALLDRLGAQDLTPAELAAARDLAARLPDLGTALAECGLPDTLLHGDAHPGNWRFDGQHAVALDFSDAFIGHPAVDGLRPRPFLPESLWPHAADAWVAAWQACRPGSDPARAITLAAPLADLAYAVRYQEFLDGIEDSERIYHRGDPAGMIRKALRTAAASEHPALR